jgi:fatty-acyl-CoA synthase
MAEWTLDEAHKGQRNLSQTLRSCSPLRPDRKPRDGLLARDTALYIYTSGTTGLPKAARITHMRAQLYMKGFAGATGARADDRIYITLPLYHATGGLCAVGAALLNGGSIVLRRKFSASQFWEEAAAEKATMFVYIGELGRYLANSPAGEFDRAHKIRLAFGNGLNAEVWRELVERFAIPQVLEFYGSTEGNVSMFNFDGTLGAIGRMPKYLRGFFNIRLVKFDIATETPVRGANGFCIETDVNEPGECVGAIRGDARSDYTGYADKAASEKKIAHDVFAKGDRWFRTGDLLRQDADGYFYFVDRIGDTFRWKGENVSTSEVATRLGTAPGVKEINVYGVSVADLDGRAGMAALVTDDKFDIAKFAEAADELPPYARPLFVRRLPELATTGTFKVRKVDLVTAGFDPAKVTGDLWFREPDGGYVPVTRQVFESIMNGGYRI